MKLDVQPKCLAVGPGGYTVVVCIGQVRPASAPSVRAGPCAHAAAPPREEAGTLLAKGLRSWSHPGRAGAVAASPSGLTAHGRVTRKDMSRSRLLCKFFRKRGAWSSERPGDFSTAAWWWRGPRPERGVPSQLHSLVLIQDSEPSVSFSLGISGTKGP